MLGCASGIGLFLAIAHAMAGSASRRILESSKEFDDMTPSEMETEIKNLNEWVDEVKQDLPLIATKEEQGVILGLTLSLSSIASVLAAPLAGWLIDHALLSAWAWTAAGFSAAALIARAYGSARVPHQIHSA